MVNNKTTRTPREDTQIAVMANDLKYVVKSVDDLSHKIDNSYVTKDAFGVATERLSRLEKVVYGAVGLILITVLGGLMTLILRR